MSRQARPRARVITHQSMPQQMHRTVQESVLCRLSKYAYVAYHACVPACRLLGAVGRLIVDPGGTLFYI